MKKKTYEDEEEDDIKKKTYEGGEEKEEASVTRWFESTSRASDPEQQPPCSRSEGPRPLGPAERSRRPPRTRPDVLTGPGSDGPSEQRRERSESHGGLNWAHQDSGAGCSAGPLGGGDYFN
ncbi:hypothetical protein EYF80_040479 [Liparis tanakae]|uniref:Uncharacterized protein n=1 Tax=Liparis tanakae TaxID=230148 RepID=A0A4Z2G914_9TELE|nr:hypothetical protein EYF80_040479 [Liparis tanakae]